MKCETLQELAKQLTVGERGPIYNVQPGWFGHDPMKEFKAGGFPLQSWCRDASNIQRSKPMSKNCGYQSRTRKRSRCWLPIKRSFLWLSYFS